MRIVSVNTSHDSSVAQITDDTIDFVLDEPRFRRDKWWCPLEENESNQYVSINHKQITDVDHLIFASYDRR